MQGRRAICVNCIHLDEESGLRYCNAFPEGIPDEIILMDRIHLEPYEGDGDVQFEPKPGTNLLDLGVSRVIETEETEGD